MAFLFYGKLAEYWPFRKEYARSGNRGLKKMKARNRLLSVTAVFFFAKNYIGKMNKAGKRRSGRK